MTIYDKPVRLLMSDFVKKNGIVKGQVFSRKQVITWFKNNYSLIQAGTVTAHLTMMSTNTPSRFHYKANPNGDDDLFFQIDRSHFRLYDPINDPPPIYDGESQPRTTREPVSRITRRYKQRTPDVEKNIHEYIYGDDKDSRNKTIRAIRIL